jgi:PAS domain S-box-containing protein
MPAKRELTMRQLRQMLRLHHEGLGAREIGRRLGVARSTIQDNLKRVEAAGLAWPLAPDLSDEVLEQRLFSNAGSKRAVRRRTEPDWAALARELKRPGVNLVVLWEEYRVGHPDGYGYSRFCDLFREFEQRLSPVMRQTHVAGDKVFVDYSGKKLSIVDPATGEIRQAEIFVAVLGASGYTYAEVTWTQTLPDWIGSHVQMFEFFQGCARLVVPDYVPGNIIAVTEDRATVEEFTNWVHPDDVEKVWAAYHRALDPAQPERSPTQFRLRRGDGEVRWVETQGLARLQGVGRERRVVSFIGTVQDITERKEQQEREHLLMREINHRAKNMLSVVDAIAHQTATKTREDFIERFSERIQALAANQDLLIRNEWRGVEVEDLVRAQLAPFADLIGSRIVVRGPELRLNAAAAQAIGLALHELATNAGKYGALSTDTGGVDIRWGTDADTFTMLWIEREGPLVSAPQHRGFGTVVIEAMAERTLNGKVELLYPPSGVTWRLTCPAADALEPL